MRELATLDGLWRFRTGNDGKAFLPAYDDSRWAGIPVPAHWHNAGYPYHAGDAWYRTTFPTPALAPGERCLLRFAAVDYQARVWVNGALAGEHEGYFAPFTFDITPHLSAGGKNVLAVHVANPPAVETLVKGATLRWDCKDPKANPGGIWQSVHLLAVGPTEIVAARTQTTLLPGDLPVLHLAVRVAHRGEPVAARLRIRLQPQGFAGKAFAFEKPVGLFAGEQELCFDLELPGAQLWWPWDWGRPCLYELALDLEDAGDGAALASHRQRCGLRQVTRGDRWAIYINGRQVFLRGANYLSDGHMSTMTAERYRRDVELARQANLNAFLPFGNIERREFYDLCDEMGMLVTQYFSIQYRYRSDESLLRRALGVLDEAVAFLDPHPAVITWIMNGESDLDTHVALDRPLAEHCRRLDPSRPVQVSSFPVMPLEYLNEDRAMHDWLAKFCHYTGVIHRTLGETGSHALVAEFGQQSLPCRAALEEIGVRQAWPPDWETITAHNGWQDELRLYETEQPAAQSLEELIACTQRYQGEMVRYYVDHMRCHRGSYCNGAFLFQLVDSWPAVTWSAVDYARRPKDSYHYAGEAFAPVTLAPDCPPVFCLPGEALEVPLYAVNDTPHAARLQATVTVRNGRGQSVHVRSFDLDAAPAGAQEVEALRFAIAEDAAGETWTLEIDVSVDGVRTPRRPYRLLVRPAYDIPLADPALGRAGWSWYRHGEGQATVSYENERDRTFARLRPAATGACWLFNACPLHGVPASEWLEVSLEARAHGGAETELAVGFHLTDPVELHHYANLRSEGVAGEPWQVRITADGEWHRLTGRLRVPECPQGRELHLGCWCRAEDGAAVDVTSFSLRRRCREQYAPAAAG